MQVGIAGGGEKSFTLAATSAVGLGLLGIHRPTQAGRHCGHAVVAEHFGMLVPRDMSLTFLSLEC